MQPVLAPERLLAELESAGYRVCLKPEGNLGVAPPYGVRLPEEMRQQIVQCRNALIVLLQQRSDLQRSIDAEAEERERQYQAEAEERSYKSRWRKTLSECAPPPDWTDEDEEAHQAYWR